MTDPLVALEAALSAYQADPRRDGQPLAAAVENALRAAGIEHRHPRCSCPEFALVCEVHAPRRRITDSPQA